MRESVIYQEILQEGKQLGFTEGKEQGFAEGEQRGKQRGKREGKKEGLAEGLVQGERKLALQMLEWKFGKLSVKARRQVEQLTSKQIEVLCQAALKFTAKRELADWLAGHTTTH